MKDKKGAVYVPIYLDWLENTQDLSAEEKGHLIDAVILYASEKDEWIDQLETSGEKIAFRFMKGQIDRNKKISDSRSAARLGKTGTNENEQEESGTNDIKAEQNGTKLPKEKEEEKEKDKENKKDILAISERFTKFWSAYPRHVGKQVAQKAFEKLKPDDGLLAEMLNAIEQQKKTAQWQESGGQYIPHPATWLNGRRWEDETTISAPQKKVTAQQYEQRDYSGEQNEAMQRMLMLVRGGA